MEFYPIGSKEGREEAERRIKHAKETNATELDLGGLGLKEFPETILELSQLIKLDLNNNNLGAEGAKAIAASLTSLTSLHLNNNNLGAEGAKALASLTSLTSLNLWDNNIGAEGAKAIAASLTSLTSLNLDYNTIGDEGAKAIAASLTSLTSLNLNNNTISAEGAKAIAASLPSLTTLDLHSNSIGAEGAKAIAASLPSLTTLNLNYNTIGDEGAKAIAASLPSLTTLYLNNNTIGAEGAKAIASSLPSLTSLNLWDNTIGAEGAKAIAASLTSLTSLNLDYNAIGDEGAKAIAASLPSLTSLNLWDNNIGAEGAKAIAASLTSLTSLNLDYNTIGDEGAKAIFNSSLISTLRELSLRENDIRFLNKEEVDTRDAQALFAIMRRKLEQKEELQQLNEAKLIVVGEEAVGKTSLIRYLVMDQSRNPDEQKTPGTKIHDRIETQGWRPDKSEIKLNIWDFGGQDIYHNIHRYFLTERSLYLLVLEDRRENDKSIYRWLKTIRDRAGDAPVLVVINKSEEGKEKLQLDETGLKEGYDNIVGFLRTCCDPDEWSKSKIQALRERIIEVIKTDDRLKHVYDKVTPAFLRVKKDITEQAASCKILDHARFSEICAKGADGNVKEEEAITDEAEQRGILSTLDHLGVIVAKGYDRKQPLAVRHVHMLDPTWLTDAIYTILTKTKESLNNGEFQKTSLSEWLSAEEYNYTHHDYVLEMMQHKDIGLCFKLPDIEPETYLVPEALGVQTPHLNIKEDALRFRYRYEILPEGLIPRFIVEANQYLPKGCARWRTGVTLEVNGCYVIVQGSIEKKQIDIVVEGHGNQNLKRQAMSIIRNRLKIVHGRHKEINPIAFVPLPDAPNNEVEYKDLLYQEEELGGEHKIALKGSKVYRVRELIERIDGGAVRPNKNTKEITIIFETLQNAKFFTINLIIPVVIIFTLFFFLFWGV